MDPRDRLFGEIAVRLQLLTREQVNSCVKKQTGANAGRIGEIAVQLGFITAEEAELIGTHQQRILERRRAGRSPQPADPPPRAGAREEQRVATPDPRAASGRPGAVGTAPKRKAQQWEAAPAPAPANLPPTAGDAIARGQAAIPAPAAPMELADTRPDPLPEEEPPGMALADTAPGDDEEAERGAAEKKKRKADRWAQASVPQPTAARPHAGGAAGGTMLGAGLPLAQAPTSAPPAAAGDAELDAFPGAAGAARVDVGQLEDRRPPLRSATPEPVPATQPTQPAAAPQPVAMGGTMLGTAPEAQQLAAQAMAAAAQAAGMSAEQAQQVLGKAGGTMFGGFAGHAPAPVAVPTPAQAAAPMLTTPPPRAAEQRPATSSPAAQTYLGKALTMAMQQGASDLHAHSGAPIMLRIDGVLRPLGGGAMAAEAAEKVIAEVMTDDQWKRLRKRGEVDFAHAIAGIGRFRVNVYRQQRGLDVVFRLIAEAPPGLQQLGLPARLAQLCDHRTGMVLCTGPSGCGKSTTLASLLNVLVQQRPDHILTVEDPIEYVFPPGQALVNQRQVGDHTGSFARALRAALREDPDIIAITELRDRETVGLAISAAETGHLVLGTLHTGNAGQTISRIINTFPAEEREQIRSMLAESLRAVVSQRLVPMATGRGRVPAIELLMVNTAVANLIRDGKTHQLPSVMQTGKAAGMITLDDSLAELVSAGTVTTEAARKLAMRKERFK